VIPGEALKAKATQKPLIPFSSIGVRPASAQEQVLRITFGIKELDEFLQGGLPFPSVIEWGMPMGLGGRNVLFSFLKNMQHPQLSNMQALPFAGGGQAQKILWAYTHIKLSIYPPAWSARGLSLMQIKFAKTAKPMVDLQPVFMSPLFRVIVLDVAKTKSERSLSADDFGFLAQRARINQQVIMVLRDFFLSPRLGNVWARLRLNCWQDDKGLHLRVVRGLSSQGITLPCGL
jgi:hypothetical protein